MSASIWGISTGSHPASSPLPLHNINPHISFPLLLPCTLPYPQLLPMYNDQLSQPHLRMSYLISLYEILASAISQSSDSVRRGRALGHGDSTSGYNASNSDDIPETSPSKKAEKSTAYTTGSNHSSDNISVASLSTKAVKTTPSNYLARAYRTIRTNKKR